MLRFFEPEMETGWPFSAVTLDFNPFPPIRRDLVFSLLPQSSQEFLFSGEFKYFSAGNDGFLCVPNSYNVPGLNSLLSGGFLIDNKDRDSFQPETLSPTIKMNSLSSLTSFPVSEIRTADLHLTPKERISPKTSGRIPKMNKMIRRTEIESEMQELKRQKFSSYPSRYSDKAAISPAWQRP